MAGGQEDHPSGGEGDHHRFRAILEHAPVMIDSFDDRGRCVLWNRECERQLGFTQQEVAAMDNPLEAFYPDPAERERARAAIARCDGIFRQYRVMARDGAIKIQRWADFRLPGGAVIAVGLDVTEQVRMEERLQKAQKMDALGQLAGGIAHDFNNLLTIIQANAEIARRNAGKPGAVERATEEIKSAAERGTTLVRQLMTFGRQGPLRLEPVDIGALVERIRRALSRLYPETIELSVDTAPSLPLVLGDAAALEQILLNLTNNARDALGGRGRIHLSTRRAIADTGDEQPHVVMAVVDDGTGMSAETRERIFEPFFTTKPPGRGSGLGLTTAYSVTKQHHGFIDVTTAEGQGTRVEVWLPATAQTTEPSPPEARGPAPEGHETILVVEDDEAVRRVLVSALEELGYRVIQASDGYDALDQIQAHSNVALVLSDAVMPRMTGVELFAELRSAHHPAAFAFTSGHAPEKLSKDIEGVPMLAKPWTMDSLGQFVREVMKARGPKS